MSILAEYFAGLRSGLVAVIGMGVSNEPLVRMLLGAGCSVVVRDRAERSAIAEKVAEFEALGATFVLGEGYLDDLTEAVIFRTPGLSPNTAELVLAGERGSVVTSEMEVFLRYAPCHTIGITGSDGKTTTTTIISEMLKGAGNTVFVGGNIGTPLLPRIDEMGADDWAVMELSSFQLMNMPYSPDIAVVTNLSPNHLDYHHTMEEYVAAKANVFTHQRPDQRAVFNADNELTEVQSHRAAAQTTLFSRQRPLQSGVSVVDGVICVDGRAVLPVGDILLPGVHNVENYMAAIAAVDGIVSDDCIRAVAQTFGGVAHRMQLIAELAGVKYYNDSIGTSPTRTIACLQAFTQRVILIAGGYDKQVPFDELGEVMTRAVKHLVLTGAAAKKIRTALEFAPSYTQGNPDITEVPDFDEAVRMAHQLAGEGDIVVLSPACASFDHFKNFVVRGNRFCEIVQSFQK